MKQCVPMFVLLMVLPAARMSAQNRGGFDVRLQLDYSAAEQTIELCEGQLVNTSYLAELRGNRIAAATTGLIANRGEVSQLLKSYLDSLKYRQRIADDVYNLEDARNNITQIKELFSHIRKSNFSRRVVATIEQLFPDDAAVTVTIPVYIVALGHENVDAYVRRIVWSGDVPQFVGEGKGEVTIVLNLAHSVGFHPSLEERFVSLLSTVAHEVFHAAFGAYKDRSSEWKHYYAIHRRPFDDLLDLTQNEGIAYYLSLQEAGHGAVPRDWNTRINEVFSKFNRNAEELLSEHLTPQRASELIRLANLSGYWESYGAMAGMCMARAIDQEMGRVSLSETVSKGPLDFFLKYDSLSKQDGSLPGLTHPIIDEISSK